MIDDTKKSCEIVMNYGDRLVFSADKWRISFEEEHGCPIVWASMRGVKQTMIIPMSSIAYIVMGDNE